MALMPQKPAQPTPSLQAGAPQSMAPTPSLRPIEPARAAAPPPQPVSRTDRRTLVVGRGISLSGTITDCERLLVEGTVEASLQNGSELTIASGGTFKGEIELDEADVTGVFDGAMTVRVALVVRATGKVLGNVRTRRLTVEEGGQISGRIEMINEPAAAPAAPAAASTPSRPAYAAPVAADAAAGS